MTEIFQNIEISNTACISAVIPACNNYHFDDKFYIWYQDIVYMYVFVERSLGWEKNGEVEMWRIIQGEVIK